MQNTVGHNVRMDITDDETFGSDEHAHITRGGTLVLDASRPELTDLTIGKCGGEVRVELRVTYRQLAGGAVNVAGRALLYEGTSENTNDLDGRASFDGTVASGTSRPFTVRVRNTDEGGDFADIRVNVSNLALGENDPCPNIDAKAAALGAGFTGNAVSGCEAVRGGHRRRFQNADIYYSPSTGAHEIHGEIRRKYDVSGGPNSDLALPVTDETTTPDGAGRYNHCSGNGSLYWHPRTGPMQVRGGIRARWAQTGWERGAYGYPTSDEMNIGQNPWQWYSDFQNGVIFFEGNGVVEPATASLSGAQVLAAFAAAFRSRTAGDHRVQIDSTVVIGVSDTGYNFTRSGNRVVTYRVSGEISSGHWYIPDPNFEVTIPVQFLASPQPDARRDVALSVRQAGVVGIHVDNFAGIGIHAVANALHDKLAAIFNQPILLGSVPAAAGLLSFKVMKDGGLTLYFRPDVIGRFAAGTAQNMLNAIRI
ncbi:LGFP repeat-containing protein [Deinococcus arenicola]|uniref:LGFP repeat-containing protein n=1 Tax=Deinococcus arenicola TaxID=2994950 RepID=A0ABU4DSZ9_9DEIO|nr:hypothetical protein [Deinococcus sp. ZS9-10]MDV6375558.1 hypothetical protein [Deinococcus sp. ZS9-10]